jgi:hypothetical protein
MRQLKLTTLFSLKLFTPLSLIYWYFRKPRLSEEEKLVISSKKKAYDILLETMSEYWTLHPNGTFDHFMMIMWPTDYKIMKNTDIKRHYSEWKNLLFMLKPQSKFSKNDKLLLLS